MGNGLEGLDLLADLGTMSNTGAAAKGIAIQNQMLFDAMTPEQQARVIAAWEARKAIANEQKEAASRYRIGLFLFLVGILCVMAFFGVFSH
jgi:hypothetical protein